LELCVPCELRARPVCVESIDHNRTPARAQRIEKSLDVVFIRISSNDSFTSQTAPFRVTMNVLERLIVQRMSLTNRGLDCECNWHPSYRFAGRTETALIMTGNSASLLEKTERDRTARNQKSCTGVLCSFFLILVTSKTRGD
jgi:hypothetical protein